MYPLLKINLASELYVIGFLEIIIDIANKNVNLFLKALNLQYKYS